MANLREVYKCEKCGNIVEVLHSGFGKLVCCNEPMVLMTENTVDASKEKHVPVIEKQDNKVKISVGSVAHPMEEKHYIEWIELIDGNRSYKRFLQPGDEPVAEFEYTGEDIRARAYCNLHGLWSAKL
ncbi:MAG TPA: desulfoferrodoxin [Clostridia bacterium]|nr:desulfoferrodoxin [Clostridia bacterium]